MDNITVPVILAFGILVQAYTFYFLGKLSYLIPVIIGVHYFWDYVIRGDKILKNVVAEKVFAKFPFGMKKVVCLHLGVRINFNLGF